MKVLNKILSSVLAFMVAAMVVVCCWQVITRFVLGNPSKYTEEILRFALIWLTMLGAPYAYGAKPLTCWSRVLNPLVSTAPRSL